jgi:hypothetical protein
MTCIFVGEMARRSSDYVQVASPILFLGVSRLYLSIRLLLASTLGADGLVTVFIVQHRLSVRVLAYVIHPTLQRFHCDLQKQNRPEYVKYEQYQEHG